LLPQSTRFYREQAQQGAPDGKLSGGVEKPEFCPNKLEAIAAHMDGVDAEWLAARSPIRVDECTPASFLHALFSTGEKVLVFSVYGSQGQVLWTHPGLPCDECALDRFRTGGPDGVWFLSNPCDGCFRSIPRLISENNPTGRSRRAEENLTDFRHLLIESDMVEPDLWLAALVQIPLPILSIVTSGGRSIHALCRTGCHNKTQWEELVERRWKPALIRLGACRSSISAVRLTRLPCCRRGKAIQQLLYLNPEPDFTPISELKEPS
jgi:hypothetical protein